MAGDPFGLCHTGKMEGGKHRVALELQRFGRAGRVGAAWLEILSKTIAKETHLGRVGGGQEDVFGYFFALKGKMELSSNRFFSLER